jgi:hypothetical protein
MNLGHGHRRSVLILWTWTALLSGFVLYPTLTGQNPTYLPFGIAALGVVLYTVLHPSVRQRRRANGAAAAVAVVATTGATATKATGTKGTGTKATGTNGVGAGAGDGVGAGRPAAGDARQSDDTSTPELPTIDIDH